MFVSTPSMSALLATSSAAPPKSMRTCLPCAITTQTGQQHKGTATGAQRRTHDGTKHKHSTVSGAPPTACARLRLCVPAPHAVYLIDSCVMSGSGRALRVQSDLQTHSQRVCCGRERPSLNADRKLDAVGRHAERLARLRERRGAGEQIGRQLNRRTRRHARQRVVEPDALRADAAHADSAGPRPQRRVVRVRLRLTHHVVVRIHFVQLVLEKHTAKQSKAKHTAKQIKAKHIGGPKRERRSRRCRLQRMPLPCCVRVRSCACALVCLCVCVRALTNLISNVLSFRCCPSARV